MELKMEKSALVMTRKDLLTQGPEGVGAEAEREEDLTAEVVTIIHTEEEATAETDIQAGEGLGHPMIEIDILEEGIPAQDLGQETDVIEKLRKGMTEISEDKRGSLGLKLTKRSCWKLPRRMQGKF